jgi:hypothetical protein
MTSVSAQPFSGTYRAQPVPSSFAFAVRHSGVFWYRGSLSAVAATLSGDGDALALEGGARVDSISVVEPPAMRASVLGPEFFDAERHPRSRSARRQCVSTTAAWRRSTASSRCGVSHARSAPAVTTPRLDRLRRGRRTTAPHDHRPPRVRIRVADAAARRRGRLGGGGGHRSAAQARGRRCRRERFSALEAT